MSVKFFINSQTIGRLGAAAVGYVTAHRLGLNPTGATIGYIVSTTLASWSTQIIKHQYNFEQKNIDNNTRKKRVIAFTFLRGISFLLVIKTAQIATEKLGVPLSFVQCAGVCSLYGSSVESPFQNLIRLPLTS